MPDQHLVPSTSYPIVPREAVAGAFVTQAFELPGYKTIQTLGVVRGIVVRSRSVIGNFAAGLQMIFGGNISIFAEMCEKARIDAFHIMMRHAAEIGANAIIGMRYDATEVAAGVTEVLAYGTAVIVEPHS
jgi:uncharacterized protein YbjQ (UPF0145 family)